MFEEGGYVEAMQPVLLDNLVDALEKVYLDWEKAPLSEFGMREYAKKDLLNFLKFQLELM